MDSTLWYLCAFAGIFVLSFLIWALKFLAPNLRNRFVRHVKYPLCIKRARYWDSLTRLETGCVVLFVSINMIIVWSPFTTLDLRQVERRAAFAAAINMVPLCLGGRMGPVVEAFNVHRSTYRLLHHWIGRMAILDGLIHAAVVISLRPRPGLLVTSGWAVCSPSNFERKLTPPQTFGTMLASVVFSCCLLRVWFGRWFLLSHRLMTLSGLGAMFWHTLQQPQLRGKIIVGVSAGIWIVFTIWRFYNLFGRRLTADVIDINGDSTMLKVEVALRKPVRVTPGKYFNIFFPGTVTSYALLHSYSAVAFWHDPDEAHPSRKISSLSFLLTRRGSHAVALSRLQRGDRILLEGPFGQDLKLETSENIILSADGVGIAGILPLALELAERKKHDDNIKSEIQSISRQQELLRQTALENPESRDADKRLELQQRKLSLMKKPLFRDNTKKVDIFWSLDSNTQMDIVHDQLRALQQLDPENVSPSFQRVCC